MNRKDELTAQIAAHEATLELVKAQIEAAKAELAALEAEAPKVVILTEVTPEAETPAAPELDEKMLEDLHYIIGTEVHVIAGYGRSGLTGHGGAKAAQTRKVNALVRNYDKETLAAGLAAVKADTGRFLHYTQNTTARIAAEAERNSAYRLGL